MHTSDLTRKTSLYNVFNMDCQTRTFYHIQSIKLNLYGRKKHVKTFPFDKKRQVNPLLPSDVDEEEEDLSGLHPGALLYRSAALQNFPVMADALAHGADVNWVNVAEESSTPLIQAVTAVRTALNSPLNLLLMLMIPRG